MAVARWTLACLLSKKNQRGRRLGPPPSSRQRAGVRRLNSPRWPVLKKETQVVENDQDCVRCRHPMSKHEVEDAADENGDSKHKTRGPCEVHSCSCPGFSPPR